MAGLTKEARAERAAQTSQQIEPVDGLRPDDAPVGEQIDGATVDGDILDPISDGLIAMVKDGEELRIHPTCVQAHKESGWKVEE